MRRFFTFLSVVVFSILCAGCASIPDDIYVAPDPDNPFTGTWVSTLSSNYMHIIQGSSGAWYIKTLFSGYQKQSVYTIEQNGDTFVISSNGSISIDGDILYVGNMSFKRIIK